MDAQEQFRINAAPLTASVVLFAAVALGAIAGYAIGTADRWSGAVQPTDQAAPQPKTMRFPPATQPPVREPQNSYD